MSYKLPISCDSCPKIPKWYLLKVISGREGSVKNRINELSQTDEYRNVIIKADFPTIEVEKEDREKGKTTTIIQPTIKGYVYVKCVMSDNIYFLAKKITGAVMWLGMGGIPNYLSDVEVNRLGLENDDRELSVGDIVKITNGNFTGTVCEVVAIKDDVVVTNINFNDQMIPVEIDIRNVERVIK